MERSKWYVVTGGPSSGKSSVLAYFEKIGYRVIPEAARVLIDEEVAKGKTIEEIRRNEADFQRRVLALKLKIEKELPKDQLIFLDRAVPDSIAYYSTCGLNPKEALDVCQGGQYKKVFLMEQLPYVQDYARTENAQSIERLNQLLRQIYERLGYEVILVPVMSVEDRVKFIQSHIERFQIGLFTSAWDKVAWELVDEVYRNIQNGLIPNSEIAFVFVSREERETRYGDLMIHNVQVADLPLMTFSSARFKPELRERDRAVWRLEHDREVMKLLPSTDLIVLLGYMWWFGEEMCQKRTAINLHPALPTGPKGTYREVIWQLIRERAIETGVMMHLVTPELDRGPIISFCHFSIRGGDFDPFWQDMEKRLKKETLEEIAAKEGENN